MITKLGKQKLEDLIKQLEDELARTLEERRLAAAEGDLRENSAYLFMGERAQVLLSQIDEAKADLKNSTIQQAPTQTDTISFGHKVTVLFDSDKREVTITLVGKNDSNLKPGWVSLESPLGKALLNKKKSEKATVNDQSITILDIQVGEI